MLDIIMMIIMGAILVGGLTVFWLDKAEEHIFSMLLLMIALMAVSAVGGLSIVIP